MDPHIEIIRKVTGCTHIAEKLRDMSGFYAADFVYVDPIKGRLNFDQHCLYLESVKQNSEFKIISIENKDSYYEMKHEVTIIHSDSWIKSTLNSTCKFYFKDGIIQKIKTSYYPTPMQLAYIIKNVFSFSKS